VFTDALVVIDNWRGQARVIVSVPVPAGASDAALDALYAEAAERPKIMSIAHHPYLSGSPHRFADVERTYVDLLARPGVVCWDGEQILDWYLGALRGG
jgi:hypothetical protein